MKKIKKKKPVNKKSLEELLSEYQWSSYIGLLPKEIQRLAMQSIDAFNNGNIRRAAEIARQILNSNFANESVLYDVFYFMLMQTQVESDNLDNAIECGQILIDRESKRNERLNIETNNNEPIEFILKTMSLSHEERMEAYELFLGEIHHNSNDNEAALAAYEKIYPFKTNNPVIYLQFLAVLTECDKKEEIVKVTSDIITRFENNSNEHSLEVAILLLRAYFCRILYCIDSKKKQALETFAKDILEFLSTVPAEIASDYIFMHALAANITHMSTLTEDVDYRVPFKMVLDGAEKLDIFNKENDEDGAFQALISSGYEVLEDYGYQKDKKLHKFVSALLWDMIHYKNDISDLEFYNEQNSNEGKLARLDFFTVKWYLFHFAEQSNKNLELCKTNLEHIKNNYPYKWKILDECNLVEGLNDVDTEIEKILIDIYKINGIFKDKNDLLVESMETCYKKTWDEIMKA